MILIIGMLLVVLQTMTLCSPHMETGMRCIAGCCLIGYLISLAGGAFADEFSTNRFVKVLYLLITLSYFAAPTKCCSTFYKTLQITQVIFTR